MSFLGDTDRFAKAWAPRFGPKHRFHYRCARCEGRRKLLRLDLYVRVPRCQLCNSKRWYIDRYRARVELRVRPCRDPRCMYAFPHRKGSRWCVYAKVRPSDEECEDKFGRGHIGHA